MSITKSYNRHTNTYYAYETSYEWDETKQKKVQKKRCIGKFDPKTGEVIPNGKVGRPSISDIPSTVSRSKIGGRKEAKNQIPDDPGLQGRLTAMENRLRELSGEARQLSTELERIADSLHPGY